MIRSVFIIYSENPLQPLLPSKQPTLLHEHLHGTSVIHNACVHRLLMLCRDTEGLMSRRTSWQIAGDGSAFLPRPRTLHGYLLRGIPLPGQPVKSQNMEIPEMVQARQDFPRPVDFLASAFWTFRATGMICLTPGSGSSLRKSNMERLPWQQG